MTALEPLHPERPLALYAEPGPIERNPARVYIAGLKLGGQPTQATALANIAELARTGTITRPRRRAPKLVTPDPARAEARDIDSFPWASLRYEHTRFIRAGLAERMPIATANRHLVALRRTLKEAWRLGLISGDDYQRAVDVQQLTGSTLPKGRHITAGEVAALVAAAQRLDSPIRERDTAMLALFFGTGGRLTELEAVELEDLEMETGRLKIRKAKRSKERYTYLAGGALGAAVAWLGVRGDWPGALLCPISPSGEVLQQPLTQRGIRDRLEWLAEQAKVKRWTPHDARRTFATDLFDHGVDVLVVQRLMGHESADTTAKYDRRPETAKQAAAGKLHFPYSPAR